MTEPLSALADRQRELIGAWLPGASVEADMGWGLVETTVLRVRSGGRLVVVKAGGASDAHIAREIRAHREWTGPWVRRGRAARLLHADTGAKILVTEYLPGTLVQDTAAAADPDVYAQAGALLREFHGQAAADDPDYEARMNAKALAWLDRPHGIAPGTAARLAALVRSWPSGGAACVPTHGDWQTRNWLLDHSVHDRGVLRVIDFGRADLRPAAEDFERLAVREFLHHPGAEEAFVSGYGRDPREPAAWLRQRVRSAIGTACWARQVGDAAFEAQGHRMIEAVLAEVGA
ncbi:aminoglycoside phosphotransferase family protein [Glycomyces sp. NPDC047010]|uniref:phosphotransferase family protein n=1 Tax=Glycomyces sp. NPDC047010 TaxID=3155023 RepID=UPI003411C627